MTATETTVDSALAELLIERQLAGAVRTTREQSLRYIDRTLTGDTGYTFGLSDWQDSSVAELVAATDAAAGDVLTEGDAGTGWISPERVIDGIHRHADALRRPLREGGVSVLLATGHPMGLLDHYAELARALRAAGNRVLQPLDNHMLTHDTPEHRAGTSGIRFICGVACAFENEAILHTHRPDYMTAMLQDLSATGQRVDLVIADHGMAGAAIEAGLETLSIADVNDSALMLAQHRGRHHHLLCVEDNLPPAQFHPVTEHLLSLAHTSALG
ncbi:phosphatase [Propionibacteriaceae bacterium Y1700]|uniref:phosphatase n=1 Tax=Microlunatus sp. Y1700 TaxID=3418487 RepID=UPI003DA6DB9D